MCERSFTFAVIGGGIAGVSCVEQILELEPDASILLVSATPVVKEATNVTRLTKTIQDFIVVEKSLRSFREVHQTVQVLEDSVSSIDWVNCTLTTKSNGNFSYRKLCLCTGASPKPLTFPEGSLAETSEGNFDEGLKLYIRDTDSVAELAKRVETAKRVLLVGNGGIATELVYELENVDIVWVVKDKSISSHYMDCGAAEFFIQAKLKPEERSREEDVMPGCSSLENSKPSKRRKYTISSMPPASSPSEKCGIALGPDWHTGFSLQGDNANKIVTIEYETEVQALEKFTKTLSSTDPEEQQWNLEAKLTNGKSYGVDFIICAIGVNPNIEWFPGAIDSQKGIYVNGAMRTSLQNVYAAGDVCCPTWPASKHWFQMKLWTQARQMGLHAGRSMVLALHSEVSEMRDTDSKICESVEPDFCFELFTHVTRFFGFKVVLLGLYNGQGIDPSRQQLLLRCSSNVEYIKVVLEDWRMQGAILIGETGLEETFENLILNQVDLSSYGEDLLNPDIDIEDYFD